MPRLIRRRTIALASTAAISVAVVIGVVVWRRSLEQVEPSSVGETELVDAARHDVAGSSPPPALRIDDAGSAPPPKAPLDERAQIARIRELLPTDPERALELIEAADAEQGAEHEERRLLEIEALVGLQRIGPSHAKASAFYRLFPGSSRAATVERLTGYHPRPPGHE